MMVKNFSRSSFYFTILSLATALGADRPPVAVAGKILAKTLREAHSFHNTFAGGRAREGSSAPALRAEPHGDRAPWL
jgi:hypothetical protein